MNPHEEKVIDLRGNDLKRAAPNIVSELRRILGADYMVNLLDCHDDIHKEIFKDSAIVINRLSPHQSMHQEIRTTPLYYGYINL